MKLLFDANLSPKLARRIADLFPGSAHIFGEGMPVDINDSEIWRFAKEQGFSIVTADSDFPSMSKRLGCPPKVIWLQSWEYPTKVAELSLRQESIRIADFAGASSCLLIVKSAGPRPVRSSAK